MKTQDKSFNKYSAEELAESFVFPTEQADDQKQADSIAIKKLREDSSKNRTEETKMVSIAFGIFFFIPAYFIFFNSTKTK